MISVRGALYEAVMHSGTHIDAPAQVVEGTVMPAGVDEFAKKKVKMIGSDTQALDDPLGPAGPRWTPLGTAIGPHTRAGRTACCPTSTASTSARPAAR